MEPIQKPSVGRIVHVSGDTLKFNGAEVQAAIITRVWSDTCVNLTVFPDTGEPFPISSVNHKSVSATALSGTATWDWPPRL